MRCGVQINQYNFSHTFIRRYSSETSIPMSFYPYRKHILRTSLSAADIAARLAEVTDQSNDLSPFRRTEDQFRGKIKSHDFSILPVLKYHRNSFIPRIIGTTHERSDSRYIEIKMRLTHFVFAFMAFWLGAVFFGFCIFLLGSIHNKELNAAVFITLLMFLMGYSMATGFFLMEASSSKKKLCNLLEAEVVESIPVF